MSRIPRPLVKAKNSAPSYFRADKKVKQETFLVAFDALWRQLFSSPVHLDSALSKQAPKTKSLLAQILPTILLRPASTAEALGIGVPTGEPWSLAPMPLANWKPARQMAERLHGLMVQGGIKTASISEDFPPSMVEEWEKSWGKENTNQLLQLLGQPAPLSIRAVRSVGPASLLKSLAGGAGLPVQAQCSDITPMGVRLAGYVPILKTEAYERGDFEIQDEGSQLMALIALWPERYGELLSSVPGQMKIPRKLEPLPANPPPWTVVDTCAGAGGKTLALADALGGKGRVYAYDTSPKKLQALRRRAKRAGLNNFQAVLLEDEKEELVVSKFRRRAQVVLVDAPCSGWGVIRRNPDIKWRQSAEALARMPEIQTRLLERYSDLVAPGGRLVYGVCTFRLDETRAIAKAFLARHPEFQEGPGGYLGPGPTDGFFVQVFERMPRA